jgi:hypothetical protein
MKYEFETAEFGVSQEGIHLLRNRFNYKSYNYRDIDKIEIAKGHLINNWWIVFVIGLALITSTLFYSYNLYLDVVEVRVPRLYIEAFALPVIPLFLGFYCLWASLRKGETIQIVHNGKTSSLPLVTLKKDNQLEAFERYLKAQEKLIGKLR